MEQSFEEAKTLNSVLMEAENIIMPHKEKEVIYEREKRRSGTQNMAWHHMPQNITHNLVWLEYKGKLLAE